MSPFHEARAANAGIALPGGSRLQTAWGPAAEAEARVSAARAWALSLQPSAGTRGRRLEDLRLVLPPVCSMRPQKLGLGDLPEGANLDRPCGQGESVLGAAPPSSTAVAVTLLPSSPEAFFRPEQALGLEEPTYFQAPQVSVLGPHVPSPGSQNRTLAITSLSSLATPLSARQGGVRGVVARRVEMQDGCERAQTGQAGGRKQPPATYRDLRQGQQRRPYQRSNTIARPEGRPAVRGVDPLAGSLFSRETRLDAITQRKGVYEAQLCGEFASN